MNPSFSITETTPPIEIQEPSEKPLQRAGERDKRDKLSQNKTEPKQTNIKKQNCFFFPSSYAAARKREALRLASSAFHSFSFAILATRL